MIQRKLLVTGAAQKDLVDVHAYTLHRHGAKIAASYDALIKQAFKDLIDDPFRPGSKERPEIADGLRTYHISLSRKRASSSIQSPRHFVLYFLPAEDELVISRILHDARDLPRHLPDEHREIMQRGQIPEKQKPSRKKDRQR